MVTTVQSKHLAEREYNQLSNKFICVQTHLIQVKIYISYFKEFIMLATKIFPETFRNFQRLITRNQLIQKQVLGITRNPLTQYHITNLYAITNLISSQLSELQSDHVLSVLGSFGSLEKSHQGTMKSAHNIQYNQEKNFFALRYSYESEKAFPLFKSLQQVKMMHQTGDQISPLQMKQVHQKQQMQVKIRIKNCKHQKFDHPSVRQTLYFHQLKDLDKYYKYQFLHNTPLFIQDMNRKKLQMKLLDQKNPYGFPLKAPAMFFDVQIGKKVYFRIKSTYEETNVVEVGCLRSTSKGSRAQIAKRFSISGMKIPRQIHDLIYRQLFESLLLFSQQQILSFKKLAYLGGRVQKLNALMNVHETMFIQNQSYFQTKLGLV